jgi:dihydrofolate reductase
MLLSNSVRLFDYTVKQESKRICRRKKPVAKVVVRSFVMSLDGFGAGAEQSLEAPLGKGGPEMFAWFFATRTFHAMHSEEPGGETGVDDGIAARGFDNVGAWIMGRNMFGPVRGPWPDDSWKGWWGDTPPYHTPVFVLTHHKREPLEMAGGTTFYFVTGGPDEALERALEAAAGRDVRIGGGVATVRHYLTQRKIDELHLACAPVLLGRGEPLLAGIDMGALGYRTVSHTFGERAMHVTIARDGERG